VCVTEGHETMLSDIVVCGPASLCLVKPAVLSLPHCADYTDLHWSLTVVYNPTQTSQMNDTAATWRVCL